MKKKLMGHALRLKDTASRVAFIEGGSELLDCIGPFWKKLALLHAGFSPYFAEDFKKRTFSGRKQELIAKSYRKRLHVIIARSSDGGTIGYAIGTINNLKVAELDSLFVEKSFRTKGTGSRLADMMIAWFERHRVASITVNVALGNESAFAFYRRFGFFPRVTTLVKKP
jgi:ribosomal protein S18 acetylase RimI-like enzyme